MPAVEGSGANEQALPVDAHPHVDRFGVLLVLTVGAILLLSLVELPTTVDGLPTMWAPLAENALVGATFVLALRAAGLGRRLLRLVTGLVVLSFLLTALAYLVVLYAEGDRMVDARMPSVLFDVLALLTPVAVVRRLAQHRRVTVNTLLGAISAYLLIALGFALMFLTVAAVQAEPFFGSREPSTSFMYFSLTTISTVGLGDLSPAGKLAGLLTGAEAIIGQVYLVTFVAMIVALYVNHRDVDD